jgi:polysaccharide export outer membrane protein
MKVKSVLLLLALGLAAAPALARQDGSTAAPPTPPAGASSVNGSAGGGVDQLGVKKYLLGPGDTLDLRVFNESQFNGMLVVNDEGKIEVPFVDEPITAQCRTDREIKQDIVKALSKYINKPQVSLNVAAMKSRPPAVVFGAVRNPSAFDMRRRVNLLELLARSGGVTEESSGDIQIFHTAELMCPEPEDLATMAAVKKPAEGNALDVPYSVYKVSELKKGAKEANPVIWPGDIVIVQNALPIYVTGAVQQPTGLFLRENLSLSRAIAQVGGPRKGAKIDKVRIVRTKEGSLDPEILTFNLEAIKKGKQPDVALKPYDIIDVSDGSPWDLKNLPTTLLGFATQTASTVVTTGGVRIIQ